MTTTLCEGCKRPFGHDEEIVQGRTVPGLWHSGCWLFIGQSRQELAEAGGCRIPLTSYHAAARAKMYRAADIAATGFLAGFGFVAGIGAGLAVLAAVADYAVP